MNATTTPNTDPFATSVTTKDWNYWLTMNSRTQGGKSAKMAQEMPAENADEQQLLNTLRYYVEQGTPAMNDVRDFAKLAYGILGEENYMVGSGSTHVWIQRRPAYEADVAARRWPERLAIIYEVGTGNWPNLFK